MPSLMRSLLFALASSAPFVAANPLLDARNVCNADNCARAVTGTAPSIPMATRQADCAAFMTPVGSPTVPTYASACSGSPRYSSACSCWGFTPGPSPPPSPPTPPTPPTPPFPPKPGCLNGPQATAIVNAFASLLTNPQGPTFSAVATALLADSFTDTSDSINLLAQKPLGSITFPSKQAFIIGQGSQPPIPTLTTLDIFFSCDKIAWRWVAQGIGSGVAEVKGIDTFTITPAGQISEVFAEFNSGAWLIDIGNPECAGK